VASANPNLAYIYSVVIGHHYLAPVTVNTKVCFSPLTPLWGVRVTQPNPQFTHWVKPPLPPVSGGLDLLAVVTTQVAEQTLDDEFGNLSLSQVDAQMEDFGKMSNQEGL